MNLNLNGISARLYRWFYETDVMPLTLCPYFWKLVIAYMLFIPWAIITLPTRMFVTDTENGSERFLVSMLLWVLIIAAVLAIFSVTAFWGFYGEKTFFGSMQRAGLIIICVVATVSATFGIIHLVKNMQDRKRYTQREYIWNYNDEYVKNPNYVAPRPNLVKEFIKAKYNKYCPKIEWRDAK